MTEKKLRATHQGKFQIGNVNLICAVLEDGTPIISKSAVFRAFGRTKRGRAKSESRVPNMPSFIDAKNLIPYIKNELRGVLTPIEYISKENKDATGFKAEILPMLCETYLDARQAGVLTPQQMPLAMASELLLKGLSRIGIVGLIYEVTGYQEVKDRATLQAILDKYLLKEFAQWAKRFPDEFYEQMFRLKGWQWKGMKVNRPSIVGHYTNDLVYERLTPGILEKLRGLNPPDDKGRRRSKHQQWLTEDIGHPALQRHLAMLIGFERASANWGMFYRMVQRALPKCGEDRPLPIEEE